VVDARAADRFARAHVPGSLNIPWNVSFTTWAGSLVPYESDFYLIVEEGWAERIGEIARDLAMIGLDRIAGFFGPDVLAEWERSKGALESTAQLAPAELSTRLDAGAVTLLDVRSRAEWDAVRIPGAQHVPLTELPARADALPRARPIAVHCQGGARSAIAASYLLRLGFGGVANLTGGIQAWERAGLPVERR
jgi:hydroxyacylglutathione hydrolase